MSEQPNTDVNQSYHKNNRYNDKGNGHHRHRDYNHRPRGSSHNNYHRDNSGPREQQNADNTPSNNPQLHFRHFEKSIDEYDKIEKLGEGTYGEVFKAKHSVTGDLVAIKKVRMDREKEGFPITAIREISILKTLNHVNIVQLKDVIASKDKGNFFMVFEYIEHDLAGLLDAKIPFSECEIKSIVHQLLSALFNCHSQNILHRDLKASNLLITRQGTLKLADFGLSRFTQKGKTVYTNRVITRWYRPPELLLGAVDYGPKIDMWSVGCILGELLHPSKKAVFPAKTEVEQLDLVFSICGTPTEQTWPGVERLPGWKDVVKSKVVYQRSLREKLFANNVKWSKEAIDLLDKLLSLDPAQRPSASECLDHDWFWKNGKPTPPRNLPEKSINELSVRTKKIPMPTQPNGSGHPPPNPHPHPQQHRPKQGHHNGPNHPPPHDPSVEPPYKRHKTGGSGHNRGPPNGSSHQGPPPHSNDRGHNYRRRDDDRRDERRGPPPEKRE